MAFYRCYAPEPVPLRELARAAGRRRTIEEAFQAGKGLAGMDEHQVRRWTSWRRWTLLAMVGHALLAVIAANSSTNHCQLIEVIALTCAEVRRLFITVIVNPPASWLAHWPGHDGAAAINTAPASATTSDRRPRRHVRNDLRLEY